MIIYETHAALLGGYKNISFHIERLKKMGITHLQLMPLHVTNEAYGEKWGYSPVDFMNITDKWGNEQELILSLNTLKENNIIPILDVVYNHAGDASLFSESWFIMSNGYHTNYSGCGNTFDGCNPHFKEHVLDSLKYLSNLGFEGFRFDLAPVLGYNKNLEFMHESCTLKAIEKTFSDKTLIAESWSAFSYNRRQFGEKWHEHNDELRDVIRRYIKCDYNSRKELCDHIYNHDQKDIAFVTCHDGFTLWDLVSYDYKSNWENGENNKDGVDANNSKNWRDKEIKIKKMKLALAILILCNQHAMILGGDEFGRTQHGNNNSYKKLYPLDNNELDLADYIGELVSLHNEIDYSKKPEFFNYRLESLSEDPLHHTLIIKMQKKEGGSFLICLNPSESLSTLNITGKEIGLLSNSVRILTEGVTWYVCEEIDEKLERIDGVERETA